MKNEKRMWVPEIVYEEYEGTGLTDGLPFITIPNDKEMPGILFFLGTSETGEFEPDENEILQYLLPQNITTQLFKAFLENAASEQGSRMSAMDNATRNAGDLIDRLTINYNRSRQAVITKELIEIISGAESL